MLRHGNCPTKGNSTKIMSRDIIHTIIVTETVGKQINEIITFVKVSTSYRFSQREV